MLATFSRSVQTVPSFTRFFAQAQKTLEQRVEDVLNERVRPVLQMDGGNVTLNEIKDGVVHVTLTGHCSGCPSRQQTLHYGILGCLQEEIPEIKDIKEITV